MMESQERRRSRGFSASGVVFVLLWFIDFFVCLLFLFACLLALLCSLSLGGCNRVGGGNKGVGR